MIPTLLLEDSQCIWHAAVALFGKKLHGQVLSRVSNASKLPKRFLFKNQPCRATRRSNLAETGCTINWPLNHCDSWEHRREPGVVSVHVPILGNGLPKPEKPNVNGGAAYPRNWSVSCTKQPPEPHLQNRTERTADRGEGNRPLSATWSVPAC